ncbi:hypothetical protein AAHH78_35305, partial [Burkholderia pseudomallei]
MLLNLQDQNQPLHLSINHQEKNKNSKLKPTIHRPHNLINQPYEKNLSDSSLTEKKHPTIDNTKSR